MFSSLPSRKDVDMLCGESDRVHSRVGVLNVFDYVDTTGMSIDQKAQVATIMLIMSGGTNVETGFISMTNHNRLYVCPRGDIGGTNNCCLVCNRDISAAILPYLVNGEEPEPKKIFNAIPLQLKVLALVDVLLIAAAITTHASIVVLLAFLGCLLLLMLSILAISSKNANTHGHRIATEKKLDERIGHYKNKWKIVVEYEHGEQSIPSNKIGKVLCK